MKVTPLNVVVLDKSSNCIKFFSGSGALLSTLVTQGEDGMVYNHGSSAWIQQGIFSSNTSQHQDSLSIELNTIGQDMTVVLSIRYLCFPMYSLYQVISAHNHFNSELMVLLLGYSRESSMSHLRSNTSQHQDHEDTQLLSTEMFQEATS